MIQGAYNKTKATASKLGDSVFTSGVVHVAGIYVTLLQNLEANIICASLTFNVSYLPSNHQMRASACMMHMLPTLSIILTLHCHAISPH
eukprot:1333426-Pleurochrysis_carterae.AAC.1